MRTALHGIRPGGLSFACALFSAGLMVSLANPTPATTESTAPETQRTLYNSGTRKLNETLDEKKLRDAEVLLQRALVEQKENIRALGDKAESFEALTSVLYNLGLVRFDLGAEELKKSPDAPGTTKREKAAGDGADTAIRRADEALAGDDMEKLVAAYIRGRGARKELKEATEAVRLAMEKHKAVLAKWQRSERDFKGAQELTPAAGDASLNGKLVDRHIAKLIDSMQQMQQCAGNCAGKKEQLSEKLKQLKGRIPAPNMPPGAAGDDDDEEEPQMGKEPGQKEGPTKEGQEMALSPEQAGWMLQGFKLDSDRRLPMGEGQQGKPKDKGGPTW
jgi:hypothetical protein